MTQIINLNSGDTVELNDDHIRINDATAKRYYWIRIISGILMLPFGVLMLSKGAGDFSQVETWLGILILLAHLIGTPLLLMGTSWQEIVHLNEVRSARVTPGLLNATLVLRLKNGKRRKLTGKWAQAKVFKTYLETKSLL